MQNIDRHVDLWELFPFTPEVGYLGLTIVSFFGSLIPFVPIPSFVLVATMAVGEQFDIHVLVVIAALTSTVAKQIIFYASYGGRKIISEKTKKRMLPFQKLVKRYGGSAAFVAAATPIPDDLVYIPLGLAKYNPKRFFVATLLGKFVLYYVIVLISHYMGLSLLEPVLQEIDDPLPVYIGIIALGIAMTVVVILLLRLNWEKILGRIAPWTLEDDDNNNQN
uniref:Putative membrane SNARE associated-like protein n=3 Tax=environmental samples TaxID=651140 RepID=A0A075H395_9ARCH|nr:putative membrane SNARE associated-like protein [uncultured marine thaumarchaeote KM3_40_A11]AIF12215.1 putative membrane SNARE associated-like protein [uncultured marine thaumarchaeote KM3_54_H01]AIF12297.1 putative membrane SNARE associated-like protein [uncultured marine thaumarchaeote KM3_55_A12]